MPPDIQPEAYIISGGRRTIGSGESQHFFLQEEFTMTTDKTNGGCSCTPNQSIKCTVNNCANHCQDADYCGLNTITVGTHESNPTQVQCTDCESFKLK